jgi:hypothetical protein
MSAEVVSIIALAAIFAIAIGLSVNMGARRYAWRSSARLIFPLGVFGSASAKSTIRGYL